MWCARRPERTGVANGGPPDNVSLYHSQQRNSWPVRALMIAEDGLDRGNGRRQVGGPSW